MEQTTGIQTSALKASMDVRVMVSRLRRRMLEVTDGDDLSPSQASVLARVGRGDASTASALASAEHVRPQSMAVILSTLEEIGLISRTPDPTDGRRQIIELTDIGRKRADGALEAGRAWLTIAFEERFTEAERQIILKAMSLLERLTNE